MRKKIIASILTFTCLVSITQTAFAEPQYSGAIGDSNATGVSMGSSNKTHVARTATGFYVYIDDEYLKYPLNPAEKDKGTVDERMSWNFGKKFPSTPIRNGYGSSLGAYIMPESLCKDAPGVYGDTAMGIKYHDGNTIQEESNPAASINWMPSGDSNFDMTWFTNQVYAVQHYMLKPDGSYYTSLGDEGKKKILAAWDDSSICNAAELSYGNSAYIWKYLIGDGNGIQARIDNLLSNEWYKNQSQEAKEKSVNKSYMQAAYMYLMMSYWYLNLGDSTRMSVSTQLRDYANGKYVKDGKITSTPIFVVEPVLVYQTNMKNWLISGGDALDTRVKGYSSSSIRQWQGEWDGDVYSTERLATIVASDNYEADIPSDVIGQFQYTQNSLLGYGSDGNGNIVDLGTSNYMHNCHFKDNMYGFLIAFSASIVSMTPQEGGRQDIYIDPPLEVEKSSSTVDEEVNVKLEIKQNDETKKQWRTRYANMSAEQKAKPFKLATKVERVNYGNSILQDTGDCKIPNNRATGVDITWTDLITGLVENSLIGTYKDTQAANIPLSGEVTLKYESDVWVMWPDNNQWEKLIDDDGLAEKKFKPMSGNVFKYQSTPEAYSEIKNNEPKKEDFEAMAGTPTTRQLYFASGGSEFIVNVTTALKRVTSERSFEVKFNEVWCDELCYCPGHSGTRQVDDGNGGTKSESYTWYHSPGCEHHLIKKTTYNWSKPITYSYLEIQSVDVWRIDSTNVNGMVKITGNEDIESVDGNVKPNIFYHIAKDDTALGGRLRYSYVGDSNGDNVKWEFDSSNSHEHWEADNLKTVEMLKKTNQTVEAISDCLILQTTTGDQSVVYFEQPMRSDDCSEKPLKFSTISPSQAWWNNSKTASRWKSNQINTFYYNGKFATPDVKFDAKGNGGKISTVIDGGLKVNDVQILAPRQDGPSGVLEMHKEFKPKVSNSNGEYKTGEAELVYVPLLNYGSPSSYKNDYYHGEYDPYNTTWHSTNKGDGKLHVHSAYSPKHKKVNDIVFHNPVATDYAIIESLPKLRDQRFGYVNKIVQSSDRVDINANLKADYRNNIIYNGDIEKEGDDGLGFALGWEVSDLDKMSEIVLTKTNSTISTGKSAKVSNNSDVEKIVSQEIPTIDKIKYQLKYKLKSKGDVSVKVIELSQTGNNVNSYNITNYSGNSTDNYDGSFTTTNFNTKSIKIEFVIGPHSSLEYDDVELYKTAINGIESFGFTKNGITIQKADYVKNPNYHNHIELGCEKLPIADSNIVPVNCYLFTDANGIKRYSLFQYGTQSATSVNNTEAIEMDTNIVYYGCKVTGTKTVRYLSKNVLNSGIYEFIDANGNTRKCLEGGFYTTTENGNPNLVCVEMSTNIIYQTCKSVSASPVDKILSFSLYSSYVAGADGYVWSCGTEDTSATEPAKKMMYVNAGISVESLPPQEAYEDSSSGDSFNGKNATSSAGNFINLDYHFKIKFENKGDFKGDNSLGIPKTTDKRGKGFKDEMDTTEWTAAKYVIFPFDVIYVVDGKDKMYLKGEPVMLDVHESEFEFYCPVENSEAIAAKVKFNAIANNNRNLGSTWLTKVDERNDFSSSSGEANEYTNYRADLCNWGLRNVPGAAKSFILKLQDNNERSNKKRDFNSLQARHSGYKEYAIDVVGRIGNNSIEDVGDFRFANIFKKSIGGWLVDNVVPQVDSSKQNNIMGDKTDIRGLDEKTGNYNGGTFSSLSDSTKTNYFNTYGINYQHQQDPLIYPIINSLNNPKNNITGNVPSVRTQPFRLGYPIYSDVQTIGNYEKGSTQILPYYSALALDNYDATDPTDSLANHVIPVDIYLKIGNEYKLINAFNKLMNNKTRIVNTSYSVSNKFGYNENVEMYDNKVYLNWEDEHVRRNTIMSTDEISDNNNIPDTKYKYGVRGEEWARTAGVEEFGQSICYSYASTEKSQYLNNSEMSGNAKDNQLLDTLNDTNAIPMEYPRGKYYVQGNNNALTLSGRARTFSATDYTYGHDMNPGGRVHSLKYNLRGQRWHYTLVLPANAVAVQAGEQCTEDNINKLKEKATVLALGIDIVSTGSVFKLRSQPNNWKVTLDTTNPITGKDGVDIDFNPFNNGFKSNSVYSPTYKEYNFPSMQIITVMSLNKSSRDDLDDSGTH